jgi:hypothetical protein
VSNALGVTVFHGFKQDCTRVSCFLFIVKGLLYNTIKQFTSNHLFSHQKVIVSLTVRFVESNDIGMLQFGHDADFNLQGIEVWLVHAFNFHNLDCV